MSNITSAIAERPRQQFNALIVCSYFGVFFNDDLFQCCLSASFACPKSWHLTVHPPTRRTLFPTEHLLLHSSSTNLTVKLSRWVRSSSTKIRAMRLFPPDPIMLSSACLNFLGIPLIQQRLTFLAVGKYHGERGRQRHHGQCPWPPRKNY